MLAVLAMSRIEAAAYRFVRLVGIVAFAVLVGIGVWSVMDGWMSGGRGTVGGSLSLVSAVGAAAVILLAPVMDSKSSWLRIAAAIGGVCGIAASCVWSMMFSDVGEGAWLLNLLGRVLSSFLLGSVTVAWLLGHAYLTARKLPIAPLRRVSRLFALAVGLRWAYLALCLVLLYFGSWGGGSGWFGSKMSSLWLILSLRVAVGLVAAGVFAYFVADCVKCRSTQSATGILYFASVFVYIGELSSQHLVNEIGLPL